MSPCPNTSRIAITDVPESRPVPTRIVELSRPEKLNCLSLGMLDELETAVRDNQTGCLVLTAQGRAFCTGLDLNEVTGPDGAGAHLRRLIAVYRCLLNAELPTVALGRGYAVGGGAGLVACARTVIVATDFRFRLPGGNLARLASVVVPICNLRAGSKGPDNTGWLGCDLDAVQAHRLGLVDKVVPSEHLDELTNHVRNGVIDPELLQGVGRDKESVSRAVQELERFRR